jgi:hypothetical protein
MREYIDMLTNEIDKVIEVAEAEANEVRAELRDAASPKQVDDVALVRRSFAGMLSDAANNVRARAEAELAPENFNRVGREVDAALAGAHQRLRALHDGLRRLQRERGQAVVYKNSRLASLKLPEATKRAVLDQLYTAAEQMSSSTSCAQTASVVDKLEPFMISVVDRVVEDVKANK